MESAGSPERDLKHLVVPDVGQLLETGDSWEPYQLLDAHGIRVDPVATYFTDLLAAGSPASTLRSYGMDLLRWWRFLWAVGDLEWDRAVREDARDFMIWMQLADKPKRVHWRYRGKAAADVPQPRTESRKAPPGTVNPVTGKPSVGTKYAATTRAHCETVLRTFYAFHLERNTGSLLVNPFPLDRSRRASRAHAHHNPEHEYPLERTGRYRPKVPERIPRRIPDDHYTQVFASLRSDRDRALLAFWVSSGARAEELLTARQADAVVGQQTIGVTRKGTRSYQELPASPDAFVWLRLYQEEAWRKGAPRGRNQPLWWTLRRPWRPLNYTAARAMFSRANEVLGSNWSLLSRPGARYWCCHQPVSPDRSPNPPYRSLGNGLSTVSAVRRGSWWAKGMGSCCPGTCVPQVCVRHSARICGLTCGNARGHADSACH
jgi:hypothetical protein